MYLLLYIFWFIHNCHPQPAFRKNISLLWFQKDIALSFLSHSSFAYFYNKCDFLYSVRDILSFLWRLYADNCIKCMVCVKCLNIWATIMFLISKPITIVRTEILVTRERQLGDVNIITVRLKKRCTAKAHIYRVIYMTS